MIKTLITADSNCYFPSDLFPEEIPLIQAEIKTSSGSFRESFEIVSENILEYTARTGKTPKLVCPSVEDYKNFFRLHLKDAQSICHLCCGSEIRDCYKFASEAAKDMENVYVADSKQVGGGMLFQVMQAVRLAKEGFSPEFIIKGIDELDKHINSTYSAEDTSWGRFLGRVPHTLSLALDFFEIAPTVTIRNGGIIAGAVFKNGEEYYKRYIRKMLRNKKNIDTSTLIISCPTPYSRKISQYKKEIEKYIKFDKISVTDISAKFICRLGENSLGLHFLNT